MLIFNYLIGNNCPNLRNGLLGSYFHKLTLGSDCLEICFWAVAFKISWLINTTNIPVACKPSFKYSSVYTVPLSFLLNLSFVCTLLTVTTQKANAGSPSISCFILQMKMTSPTLGLLTNVYGYISAVIKPYKKQTWQNGRPACSYLTLHLLMKPPKLGHLTSINSIMFT